MSSRRSIDWTAHTVRVAACGLGTALGGPLGGLVGGLIGGAVGQVAADLISKSAERFGEGAAAKILELGTESFLAESVDDLPPLDTLYREVLRESLQDIYARGAMKSFLDWFENWERYLSSNVPVDFRSVSTTDLRHFLELLDAQGAAMRGKRLSLNLAVREMPDPLCSELQSRLPSRLACRFEKAICSPKYESAWKTNLNILLSSVRGALVTIDETTRRTMLPPVWRP